LVVVGGVGLVVVVLGRGPQPPNPQSPIPNPPIPMNQKKSIINNILK